VMMRAHAVETEELYVVEFVCFFSQPLYYQCPKFHEVLCFQFYAFSFVLML
jgi:hypothetical protein